MPRISSSKRPPGLIYHQRAQSNEFWLRAATRMNFLTIRGVRSEDFKKPITCSYFNGQPILDVELASSHDCFRSVVTQEGPDQLKDNAQVFRGCKPRPRCFIYHKFNYSGLRNFIVRAMSSEPYPHPARWTIFPSSLPFRGAAQHGEKPPTGTAPVWW
jgi:hypothetical protein